MNSKVELKKIARLVDISCVRTDVTIEEIDEMVALAKKHEFICTFAMPCFTQYLIEQLRDYPNVMVGGVVGFPSGADTTNIKVQTAKEMLALGCNEIDMVSNVGALKSKRYDLFKEDISAVVKTAGSTPVKAILEIAYLTDDEIKKASELAVEAGVTYVKTGTGWASKKTTIETIKIIKEVVGERAKIKAAGGVRDLQTMLDMIDVGCDRFGISLSSIKNIIKEISSISSK